MRGAVLIALSFTLIAISTYLGNSSGTPSKGLFVLSLLLLFAGVHFINRLGRVRAQGLHLSLGVLLPVLLFLNYRNLLYLFAVPFLLVPLVSKSEKAFLALVPAGLILVFWPLGRVPSWQNSWVRLCWRFR
ncbi:hypothetical protein [Thermococcus henrietii]|uniref:hypothetical protein n=1 Tax=Thermococcus henrietii TaxID=2016361 RepID=UPI000C07D381|nr:hypothetical protein [Thermococcus henrietii]